MASPLRQHFLDHMILKGFSKETIRAYISALRGLAMFYNKSPQKLNNNQIQQYILFLIKEKNLAFSSTNVIFSAFRLFYLQILRWNETKFYLPPRVKKSKLPDILSVGEVWQILRAAANIKHRVILMLLYDCGLRTSEVTRLKVRNIDSQRMLLKIEQGKGSKDRYVLFSNHLLCQLRLYWKTYRPTYWLFPLKQKPNGHIHPPYISQVYRQAKKKTGLTKSGGAHTLRHCFATHMLEAGYEIDVLQRLLGHRSIVSTARYLHLTQQRFSKIKTPLDLFGKQSSKF